MIFLIISIILASIGLGLFWWGYRQEYKSLPPYKKRNDTMSFEKPKVLLGSKNKQPLKWTKIK